MIGGAGRGMIDEVQRVRAGVLANPRLAVGHDIPQEAPAEFAAQILALRF